MRKINYQFGMGHENFEGSIYVPDDATNHEIDRMVIDDVLSVGAISYNWSEEDSDED